MTENAQIDRNRPTARASSDEAFFLFGETICHREWRAHKREKEKESARERAEGKKTECVRE